MLAITTIAGLMAISSGMLLVFGPWYVTSHSPGFSFSALYFLVYVCITLITSSFFGFLLDTRGGAFGLRVASLTRLALLLMVALCGYTLDLPIAWAAAGLALIASGPDSIYRLSVGLFMKEHIPHDQIMRAIGNITASRQIGYMIGTAFAGVLLSLHGGIAIFITTMLILACLTVIGVFIASKHNLPASRDRTNSTRGSIISQFRGIWSELSRYKLISLFIGSTMLGTIAFLLPMNVAPLIIKVKGLSVVQLGVIETCLSVGTFLGSMFYSRIQNSIVTFSSLLLIACALAAVIFVPNALLTLTFFLLGFVLNATIPLGAYFARTCPVEITGRVSGVTGLLSSSAAAVILFASSAGAYSSPTAMYSALSLAMVIITGLLFARFGRKSELQGPATPSFKPNQSQ